MSEVQTLFVATAVMSGVLALMFGMGAIAKVTNAKSQVDNATKLKITWSRYQLIAVPEAAAAVGLVAGLVAAPLGVAAAAGIVALMAGAVLFRGRVHDAAGFIAGDAALLIVAGVTALLRTLTA